MLIQITITRKCHWIKAGLKQIFELFDIDYIK